MLARLLKKSFMNQRKAMTIMVVAVAFGTAVAASLLTVSSEISSKVAIELRAFGANILVEPKVEGLAGLSGQARFLDESDLKKIKTIFWRHNILGFVPFLDSRQMVDFSGGERSVRIVGTWYERKLQLPGEDAGFVAGVATVSPWWDIRGEWPRDNESVAVGFSLADEFGLKPGDPVKIGGRAFTVTGIVTTGGREDEQIFMDLSALQDLTGAEGKVSRVLVSALTTPMDEFAYKNPSTMTRTEYEKWYCTGYVTSIAKQVEEVMVGSRAKPIWQVAETEGKVLEKLRAAIYLLSFISLLASAIGVGTTMVTSLLRRVHEIGLMKALGADSMAIITLFLSEAVLIGCAGGGIGLAASFWISKQVGLLVFGTELNQKALLFPLSIGVALTIAVLGSLLPIVRALRIKPAVVLKGTE